MRGSDSAGHKAFVTIVAQARFRGQQRPLEETAMDRRMTTR